MEGRAKPRTKHLQHPTPRDGSNLGVKTVWKTAVDGKEDLRPRAYDPTSHEREEREDPKKRK
jgi:hypothetical protein